MLEGLKNSLNNRIERNAIKSELTWTDKKGKVHTEQVYLKRSKLPLIGDWARIYPPVNEDGTWNIPNALFGGWKNLTKLLLVLGLLSLLYFGISDILTQCSALQNMPCVQSCINQVNQFIPQI